MSRIPPLVAIVCFVLSVPGSSDASVMIPAGYDLLETDSSATYQDLDLPPGALLPYCDAGFSGQVFMKGVPFDCFEGVCDLHPTDTIVKRSAPAGPPFSTIPIEIVRLELVSVAPISVSCTGGAQTWDVLVSVPEGDTNQTPGSMTITHSYPSGGTFTSTLPVNPSVTFRRVSDGAIVGPLPGPTIEFEVGTTSPAGEWCHAANPLDDPEGEFVVAFNATTNFFPGIVCANSPGGGGQVRKKLTEEEAAQAAHGVKPAEKKHHYKCYEIEGPAVDAEVVITNQFGTQTVTVAEPRYVCPPALKNGRGDLEVPHLECYDIVGGGDPQHTVDLKTQFGLELFVEVGAAKLLCAPVLKEVVFPAPHPAPGGPPPLVPHYTCFEIAGPPANAVVEIDTQFGLEPNVNVLGPKYLCPPTIKNGEGNLRQPELKCYEIFGSDPPHVVNLESQFGIENDVPVGQAKLLCIPAKKIHPPPTICQGISDVSEFDGPTVSNLLGQITTVPVVTAGLVRPLFVTSPRGDVERLFIVEQDGRIQIHRNGSLLGTPFLDIGSLTRSPADGGGVEEGLLGLAFHPDYANNGHFFVFHTDTSGSNNIVARYTRDGGDPDLADIGSRVDVLTIPHPSFSNQNGGMLAFRPLGGELFIGTGDGGSFCDPSGNAQNLNSNLGKLLRLDVDSLPYSTAGNPFDGPTSGNDEIWAYGLRNPWRFSFDRLTQALYIGDVGQNQWEEIDCTPASITGGENYGWDIYEGNHCPNPSCGSQGSCSTPVASALHEYVEPGPRAVIGGYVYRGCRMSDLHGTYFLADNASNQISSFRTGPVCEFSRLTNRTAELDPDAGGPLSITSITSFGEDERGELYIVERTGKVSRIVPVLSILEVSGHNATGLRALQNDDWGWEDVGATSGHPIANYRVYRSDGNPSGPFNCVHQGATNVWSGGDPAVPVLHGVFYYLVTARNAAGLETRPGNLSNGTPRVVNTASACP